jgi:hypothetical protein
MGHPPRSSTQWPTLGQAMLFVAFIDMIVPTCHAQRIAIIGGGISGSFCTKYLVDYDIDCQMTFVTIFDPEPLGRIRSTKDPPPPKDDAEQDPHPPQGSRVAPLILDNGKVVELGASIAYKGFTYVTEMAESGGLEMGPPFTTSSEDQELEENHPKKGKGMAIYNGTDIVLNTARLPTANWWGGWYSNWTTTMELAWRYNVEALEMNRVTEQMEASFQDIHKLLNDPTFQDLSVLGSPHDLWKAVGLLDTVTKSLDDVCDDLGLSKNQGDMAFWRRWFLSQQGSLRAELLSAINLVNYNQDTSQVNGISGIGSFAATKGGLYSIVGGNAKLISSAYEQAQRTQQTKCGGKNVIHQEPLRIATVVGKGIHGFELYSRSGKIVGEFDVVIVAAPLPMANIDFLIKSPWDESNLQSMPLGHMIVHADSDGNSVTGANHEGHDVLPRPLPALVRRPYTQVVTTIVQNAELQVGHFGLSPSDPLPRGIYMTPEGKAAHYNVTAISQLSAADQLYKVFSNHPLPHSVLIDFFGANVVVVYEKIWGGPLGGATPDYQGQGLTTDFLLYDGATGMQGHTASGALYYPNAMETTFACMELAAVGSKAVAKLTALRLGWLKEPKTGSYGLAEEL